MSTDAEALKHQAALRAVEYVRDGMVVGLGTGTTARYAVEEIGRKVMSGGFTVTGVPTSDRTAELARTFNIPLATLEERPEIDLTIDGADEIELTNLDAIKGLGGAILYEKLVALSSKEEILIVDESKVVSRLGERNVPIPVEVVTFGWSLTAKRLGALGADPRLRRATDGTTFVTDSGNYILDCFFSQPYDPPDMASRIKSLTGVVEHGLCIGLASRVIIASASGVRVVDK